MSRHRKSKPTRYSNLALAVAMQEKRRSNAAGTHADKRTKRNRSRSAQRSRAIQDAS